MSKSGRHRNSRTAKQEAHDAKVGKEKETHKELKEIRIHEAAGGYKWEQHGGGLGHHCFQCATPLTNPCARSKCFGKHMVVCERFHNTMFKVGAENTCDSCHNYTEALHARQRDIAVLVNHIRSFDKGGSTGEPEQNANTPDISSPTTTLSATPARKCTRKEKKQAKAAVRAANLAKKTPNKVTAADIERVAKVMREGPRAARVPSLQVDGADDEDIAEEDAATLPSKASTHLPVPRVKRRRQSLLSAQTKQANHGHAIMILKSLGVKVEVRGTTRAMKNELNKLAEGIRGYYVWLEAERADVETRREGFLKFAGNQAFRSIMDILEENREWRAQGERAASEGGEVREVVGEDAEGWEGRDMWENWAWIEEEDAGEVGGEEGGNGEVDGEVDGEKGLRN